MMNKLLVCASLLVLAVFAYAQDESPGEPVEEPTGGRPDCAKIFQKVTGSTQHLPEWFQKVLAKKQEIICKHKENRPERRRPGPPRRRGPPRRLPRDPFLTDKDLEGIAIPDWFTQLRKEKQEKMEAKKNKCRVPPEEEAPKEWNDNVPEWFREFFQGVVERKQALCEEFSKRRGPPRSRSRRDIEDDGDDDDEDDDDDDDDSD